MNQIADLIEMSKQENTDVRALLMDAYYRGFNSGLEFSYQENKSRKDLEKKGVLVEEKKGISIFRWITK